MAELSSLLAAFQLDPDDIPAYETIVDAARLTSADVRAAQFSATRTDLATRDRPDVAVQLLDLELAATDNADRQTDLLIEKALVLHDDLLDVATAAQVLADALERRSDDALALEALEEFNVTEANWNQFALKYVREAAASTDRRLATSLYVAAAECFVRFSPDASVPERWLRQALAMDSSNNKAAFHLARLLQRSLRWADLADLFEQRAATAPTTSDKIAALIALADLARGALQDPTRSGRAIERALTLDPSHARALRAAVDAALRGGNSLDPATHAAVGRLKELYRTRQLWRQLIELLDAEAARLPVPDRRAVRFEMATVAAECLGDVRFAIEIYNQVLAESGALDVSDALAALMTLYRREGRYAAVVEILHRRADAAQLINPPDAAAAIAALEALAQIYVDHLHAPQQAAVVWKRILELEPHHGPALRALEDLLIDDAHRPQIIELLEPVYRAADRWQKLVVILEAQLEYIRDPAEQRQVLREIAALYLSRGGATDRALTAFERAWRIDIANTESLKQLLAFASEHDAWRQVVRSIEGGARATPDDELSADLWVRAAEIHETHSGDRASAIEAWRNVEAMRPGDLAALAALDRLLALEGRFAELALIVERRANLTANTSVRLVLLHRAAVLYDDVLAHHGLAVGIYKRLLEIDGTDLAALDALERIYRDSGDSSELAATLERKIELATEPGARQMLRHSLAVVYETQLGDSVSATGHLMAALGDNASDHVALADLDRIYAAQKQWPELIEIIDKRALLARDVATRADFAYRAGQVAEIELTDSQAAIVRYGDVLQMLPSHEPVRIALERLMQRDDLVEIATTLLERVYQAEGDVSGLRRVYERRLGVADREPAIRSADWQALAEMYERVARDSEQAFAVWRRALADDPERVDVLVPLLRLAEAANPPRWQELAAVFAERLQDRDLPPTVEYTYAMHLGQIAEDRLGDLELAATAFERAARGQQPRAALSSLERVVARSGKAAQLVAVLARQAELADSDAQAAEYMFRTADLYETTLAAKREAITGYCDVLRLNSSHGPARAALLRLLAAVDDDADRAQIADVLEPLFEQDGDAARLATVLEVRVVIAADARDRSIRLQRLAEHYELALANRETALDAALHWLALDPGSVEAQSQIVRLATALDRWNDTEHRVAAIAADANIAAQPPEARVALLSFLGAVQGDHLGRNEAAIATYRAALAIDANAVAALDPLIALLRTTGAWSALADALQQRGDSASEPSVRRAAFAEIAELNERAGDRFGAIIAWRTIAAADHADAGALAELARLYRNSSLAEDRAQLVEVLDRAVRLATVYDDEKRLLTELAQLEAASPRAISRWQSVVDLDPRDSAALLQLQAAHARVNDWDAVADAQARRLDAAATGPERAVIYQDIAQVAEVKRGSIDDAIAAWYAALAEDATLTTGYDELGRLLATANRHHDLVALLQRRANFQAVSGDLAGQVQTLTRAADVWADELGQLDAASEILEAIVSRDPGCTPALTRLSVLYERAGEWDKCRAAIEQALRQHPQGRDAADLYFRLGQAALAGEPDIASAMQCFHLAIRHDQNHVPAIKALEQIARRRSDAALLLDMLRRRLAIPAPEPGRAERVELLIEIAELERGFGRNDAALAALGTAVRLARDDVRVLAPLADLCFAVGRLDEAAAMYGQLAADAMAARRMKEVGKFRQRQGSVLEARGDGAGAIAAYETALQIHPTDVATMTALGRLYFSTGDWDKARRIYQSLVLQDGDAGPGISKGEAYWTLGRVHLELGDIAKAKSMWQRGLEIEPTHQGLRDALAQAG